MARRRGNNEGSIYKMKSGKWRGQVSLDGRRFSFVGQTKGEVQQWIRNKQSEIDNGLTYVNSQITLAEYLPEWLTNKKIQVRETTWRHYDGLIMKHIIPYLGSAKIRQLKTYDIRKFINSLIENGVGVPTVRKIYDVLYSVLDQAIEDRISDHNPARSKRLKPKAEQKEMKFFDETQASQFKLAIMGHRWEALFHLAITTGMRQMELLGLKWTDLDWGARTIRVERQLVRSRRNGVEFAPPKTKRGKRTVELGTKSIEILRVHYEKQFADRKKAGSDWVEQGLIFTVSNGNPIHYRNLLRDFQNWLRLNGLPVIRFHDLRHTAAALMLNNNIPDIVVSRRLGHARVSITLDIYGHLLPGKQSEAAQLMDDLITPIELDQFTPEQDPIAHNCTRNKKLIPASTN